jgi:hypothetical protein
LQIQASIEQLDRDIQQLKIDFERFFNGGLPTPPEEMRNAVRQQIQRLRATPIQALVDRFRLNTLEARFNTLNELFNRRLREREEGHVAPPALLASPTPRRYDPYTGIVVGGAPPPEAIKALYRELYHDDTPSATASFARFQTYLLSQLDDIRRRSGCDEVSFRLATEDGAVKLKAKPVRHTRQSARGSSHSG